MKQWKSVLSQQIANREITHIYLSASMEAKLSQRGADPEWLGALKERVSRAQGYGLPNGLLVEEHAARHRVRLRCGWSLVEFPWCACVSPTYNPHLALAAHVARILAPSLPSWMAIDEPNGLFVVSLSCERKDEAEARRWMSTRFLVLHGRIANLYTRPSAVLPSCSPFVNPVRAEQAIRRYFRVNLSEVMHLDEALAKRMVDLALDIQSAALGRERAVAAPAPAARD